MSKEVRPLAVLWPSVTQKKEKALLVGMQMSAVDKEEFEDSLGELLQLATTAGTLVVGKEVTRRSSPTPNLFIGKGKAEAIAESCQANDIQVVIFDEELSPVQVKNLQNLFGVKVIDRTELILDIFAQHATTKEGKIQVELAQLQYMLPRLVGAWTHLSRQWGGVGTRGPGERQLEVDRRRIRTQIAKLKKDLDKVGENRKLHRRRRERVGVPLVAFLGYTNAGKTTLFNRITSSELVVEDQLFTTLDATVRKVQFSGNQTVLFSDTVGFIKKLPHHLVESFKATLEEVKEADILLHVVDGSAPEVYEHYRTVVDLIKELEVIDKPAITVINKIDCIENSVLLERLHRRYDGSIAVSAKKGEGVDKLMSVLEEHLGSLRKRYEFFIPKEFMGTVSNIYEAGNVISSEYTDKGANIVAEISPGSIGMLKKWVKDE